jgi:ribosomal protein L15
MGNEAIDKLERELHEETLKKLEDYMIKHRLRKHELARILGTTETNVSRWFKRKHMMSRSTRELIEYKLKG